MQIVEPLHPLAVIILLARDAAGVGINESMNAVAGRRVGPEVETRGRAAIPTRRGELVVGAIGADARGKFIKAQPLSVGFDIGGTRHC
jgi:hypothetical protein